MTNKQGLGILEGEGILGRIGGGSGGTGGEEGVLGFGMIGKVKRSISMRVDNLKGTIQDARGIVFGEAYRPGDLIHHHISGARKANQEMRPKVLLE